MSREQDIRDALAAIAPDAEVTAEPEADGSRIVVEVDGVTHRFSIGRGNSPLLNILLTGEVD